MNTSTFWGREGEFEHIDIQGGEWERVNTSTFWGERESVTFWGQRERVNTSTCRGERANTSKFGGGG